jgi:hypothetical protein
MRELTTRLNTRARTLSPVSGAMSLPNCTSVLRNLFILPSVRALLLAPCRCESSSDSERAADGGSGGLRLPATRTHTNTTVQPCYVTRLGNRFCHSGVSFTQTRCELHGRVLRDRLTARSAGQEIPRVLWNKKVQYLFTEAQHVS